MGGAPVIARVRLACDPDQPASRLMDLWHYAAGRGGEGREMREHLAANPSSPEGVLHEALGDEEAYVRYLAARTLMRRALINAGMCPGLRDRIERELLRED